MDPPFGIRWIMLKKFVIAKYINLFMSKWVCIQLNLLTDKEVHLRKITNNFGNDLNIKNLDCYN